MQRRVRFNKAPKKVPEKVPGGFGAEPGQVQQGSESEGLGGFGAEAGQVPEKVLVQSQVTFRFRGALAQSQHGSGEGSGEGLGSFGAAGSSRKFPEKVGDSFVQSQVRLNGQGEGSEEGSRKPWCKAKSISMGSGEGFGAQPGQVQQGFGEGLGGLGSGEGSGEGVGGFGAEPGQVPQGSAEYSGEGCRKPWCKAKSGSTGSGEGCRSQAK